MIALLVVVGFIGVHWKLLLTVAAAVVLTRWVRQQLQLQRDDQASAAAERAAIAARADAQHHEVMQGDEHGVFGSSWSAMRDYRVLTTAARR